VRPWLARHPWVQLRFPPTSGPWLNRVEAFCSIITRQTLRRGNFRTVADLIAAIERFTDAWNTAFAPMSCSAGLALLVRINEIRTGRTWATVREDRQDLHVGVLTGPAGSFTQTTEPTAATKTVLAALDIPRRSRSSASTRRPDPVPNESG